MKRFFSLAVFFVGMGLWGMVLPLFAQKPAPSTQTAVADFSDIEKLVWKQFNSQKDFRNTDLITREDVEALPKKLAAAGFTLKKPEEMLDRLLPKSDFLCVQLNTDAGRKFMRQVSSYPNGYDRIDRLSRLPIGQQTVRDLIRGPGGEKMIEYMTTSDGGKGLGQQLSQCPGSGNFNAPTGRIYTLSDLLKYLKTEYESQQKSRKTATK